MNNYLLIFILVLCFTCWLGDAHAPPSPAPIKIDKVIGQPYGATHQENMIPDFNYNDSPKSSPYITDVEDNTDGHNVEFPMGTR